jgi:hypothetical protein
MGGGRGASEHRSSTGTRKDGSRAMKVPLGLSRGVDVAYGSARRLRSRFATAGVTGYMGSGNTWVSAMLRVLITEAYGLRKRAMRDLFLSDFPYHTVIPKIRRRIPKILQHHFLPYPEESSLRGVKEHLSDLNQTPLVIIIRDPKDTLYSCYLHHLHRGFAYVQGGRYTVVNKFTGTVDQFMRESPIGFPKWIAYYNEIASVRLSCSAPTLVVTYEMLWSDTISALKRIANVVQISNASDRMFEFAVESCRIENMREIEERSTERETLVPNLFARHGSSLDARKARLGGFGSWKGHISESTAQWIDNCAHNNLNPFYEVMWR